MSKVVPGSVFGVDAVHITAFAVSTRGTGRLIGQQPVPRSQRPAKPTVSPGTSSTLSWSLNIERHSSLITWNEADTMQLVDLVAKHSTVSGGDDPCITSVNWKQIVQNLDKDVTQSQAQNHWRLPSSTGMVRG